MVFKGLSQVFEIVFTSAKILSNLAKTKKIDVPDPFATFSPMKLVRRLKLS